MSVFSLLAQRSQWLFPFFLLTGFACYGNENTSLHKPTPTAFDLSSIEIAQQLGWVEAPPGQDICSGYFDQPKALKDAVLLKPMDASPTSVTAKGVTHYRHDGSVTMEDHVVVTQPGRIAHADKAFIYRDSETGKTKRIILVGNVKILEHNTVVVGTYAIMDYTKNLLQLEHGVFHQAQPSPDSKNTWGTAEHFEQIDNRRTTLTHAVLSMCPPSDPFWTLTAKKVTLDKETHEGAAYHAWLRIKNTPVFYWPYLSFLTSSERKSGFLTPHVGYSTLNGFTVSTPYYLNLAPNYDYLLTPTWMAEHGLMLSHAFRFITPSSYGHLTLSLLPYDSSFDQFKVDSINSYPSKTQYINDLNDMSSTRGYVEWISGIDLTDRWHSDLELRYVTDPYFYNDFETNDGSSWARQLLNQWDVRYTAVNWMSTALLQGYQTMHLISDTSSGVVNQYQRLPEVNFIGQKDNVWKGAVLGMDAQFVNFAYSSDYEPYTYEQPTGLRLHMAPSLSYPRTFASGYFTPTLTVDNTIYSSNMATDSPDETRPYFSKSRTLPLFDIDSGLYMDRSFFFKKEAYTQTLEPRLFYLYVPNMDQDQYPIYDTVLLPMTFDDLFSTNAFTGYDRIQNANQLSLSVSSRVLDAETAAEKMRMKLGVINYFEPQEVCLDDSCSGLYDDVSPLLGEATIYPRKYWSTTASAAWDVLDSYMNNASVVARYSRGGRSVLNIGYDFIHADTSSNSSDSDTNLIQVGAARPVTNDWSLMGYWYYNVGDDQLESYFAGIEYSSCCWAARFTANRYFNYSNNDYNTGYYFELLLKGLGATGTSSANSLIRSGVPSYYDDFSGY